MSQGKHISPIVRQIVAAAVSEHPDTTRDELVPVIRGRVRAAGKTVPADATLLKLISRYRNQPPSDLDQPWTLARMRDYDFPAESLPLLSQVWRFALAIDEPLTIRQAYWVTKLYRLFPNPIYLWMWASAAAIGERSAELVGEPLDASSLDVVASDLSGWEQRSLALVGAPINLIASHVPPLSYVSPTGVGALELLVTRGLPLRSDDDEAQCFDYLFSELVSQLPTLDTIGLSPDAQMVYLRWLAYLVRGPKWRSLSAEDAVDLVVSLRQWILQQQERLMSAQDEIGLADASSGLVPVEHEPAVIAGERPADLMRVVGLDADLEHDLSGYFIFSNHRYPYVRPQ